MVGKPPREPDDDPKHGRDNDHGNEADDDFEDKLRRVHRNKLGWVDRQFKHSSFVLLVLVSFCFVAPALIFGVVGLAMCKDPNARRRALFLTITSSIVLILYFLLGYLEQIGVISKP